MRWARSGEDRPLAFFDGAHDTTRHPVAAFRVSENGQTLAAAICHAGYCGFEYDGALPSADSELRLWVSHDGGRSWDDWGESLPSTWIVEVTADDVLLRTRNVWRTREYWDDLTDEEWAGMLARLALLGLDELEGWEERTRWVVSGEAYSPPPEPTAPTLGDLDWWRLRDQPETAVAWVATAQDDYLLAIADREGFIERVYGGPEWFAGGSFITDDLVINPVLPPVDGAWLRIATLELVDLASASVHEVKGLALPLGFDPAGGGQQREFYHFITARPAPASATARAAIEYVPLTLSEPRELPDGVGLYFADWPYEGFANDVTRVVANGDGFETDQPWATWDDTSAYVTSFQVSDDGRTMAAAVCEQGYCEDCYTGPTEDASLRLRVSRNGGVDWEDWGELPQGAYIEGVTADDVAVTAWTPTERLWWFRSGEGIEPPAGFDPGGVQDWRWKTGSGFVWDYGDDVRVTDSGSMLRPPPSGKSKGNWYLDEVRHDGWSLWIHYGKDAEHFALVVDRGDVEAAFTWDDGAARLGVVGFLSDGILIAQLSSRSWDRTETPTTVLVDLANHSVHPVTGLDEVPLGHCDCLWFVRPAAEEPVVVEGTRGGGPL